MSNVLKLVRALDLPPEVPALAEVRLRAFAGAADVALWLDLRRRAFARQKLGVRDWTAADFEREFLAKPWWRPQAMWFAEIARPDSLLDRTVGTVTLGWRGKPPAGTPVIHWLAVLPAHRRQGIARLLVRHIERLAWDAGQRQIALETHAAWTEAGEFYRALGYRPAGD